MDGVIGRFYVAEVNRTSYKPQSASVVLRACTRGDENKRWAEATPYAEIKMTIDNPAATAVFAARLGQDFFVRFEPVGDALYPDPYSELSSAQVAEINQRMAAGESAADARAAVLA